MSANSPTPLERYKTQFNLLMADNNFKNTTASQRANTLKSKGLIEMRRQIKELKNNRLVGDRCKNNYECNSKICTGKNSIGTRWGICENAPTQDMVSEQPAAPLSDTTDFSYSSLNVEKIRDRLKRLNEGQSTPTTDIVPERTGDEKKKDSAELDKKLKKHKDGITQHVRASENKKEITNVFIGELINIIITNGTNIGTRNELILEAMNLHGKEGLKAADIVYGLAEKGINIRESPYILPQHVQTDSVDEFLDTFAKKIEELMEKPPKEWEGIPTKLDTASPDKTQQGNETTGGGYKRRKHRTRKQKKSKYQRKSRRGKRRKTSKKTKHNRRRKNKSVRRR